jgi:hypothetical protein
MPKSKMQNAKRKVKNAKRKTQKLIGGSNTVHPLNTINLHNSRNNYSKRVYKLYDYTPENEKSEEYQLIIKKNLNSLMLIAEKELQKYELKDKQKFSELRSNFDTMKSFVETLTQQIITINILNIISFQCVILFTVLLITDDPTIYEILKQPKDGVLYAINVYDYLVNNKVFGRPTSFRDKTPIKQQFIGKWYIFSNIEFELNKDNSKDILHLGKFIVNKNTNIKAICVLLGVLTFPEIINSLNKGISLIGITNKMDYADGFYYTPLEFMLHDLQHTESEVNETVKILINNLLTSFIDAKIDSNYDDNKHKLYIILFLIMHEFSSLTEILEKPIISLEELKTLDGQNCFNEIDNLEKYDNDNEWLDKTNYGGLLPRQFTNFSGDINTEKHTEIYTYLYECFNYFINEWNTFFKEK